MNTEIAEYVIFASIFLFITVILNYVMWFRYDSYVRWVEEDYSIFKFVPRTTYFVTRLRSKPWKWFIRFCTTIILLLSVVTFTPMILLLFAISEA